MIRTYTELQKIESFEDRFEYLRLGGSVGKSTFGFDRYLNQMLYKSYRWSRVRDQIIVRDNGCDLGVEGYPIIKHIVIHHMNPIRIEDIVENDNSIFNPEFLICASYKTHLAIHYGDKSLLPSLPIRRRPNDTSPWL